MSRLYQELSEREQQLQNLNVSELRSLLPASEWWVDQLIRKLIKEKENDERRI
jgi:hypothetical protein